MKDIIYWTSIVIKSNFLKLEYNSNKLKFGFLFFLIFISFLFSIVLGAVVQKNMNLFINYSNEKIPEEYRQKIEDNGSYNKVYSLISPFIEDNKDILEEKNKEKEKTKYTILSKDDKNYNNYLDSFKIEAPKDNNLKIFVEDKSKLPEDFLIYFEKNFGELNEKKIQELQKYKETKEKYIWFSLIDDTFYIKENSNYNFSKILKQYNPITINTNYKNNNESNSIYMNEVIRFINFYSLKNHNDLIEKFMSSQEYKESLKESYNINKIIDFDYYNNESFILLLLLITTFIFLTINNSQVFNFDVNRNKHILEPYASMNIPSWAIVLKEITPFTIFISLSCFISLIIVSLIIYDLNFTRILMLLFFVLLTFNLFQLSLNMIFNVLFKSMILRNLSKVFILSIIYLPFRIILGYIILIQENNIFDTPSIYLIIISVINIILFIICLSICDKLIGKHKIGLSGN